MLALADGSKTAEKRQLKARVFAAWQRRPPALTKQAAYALIAKDFGISVSTVMRYIGECLRNKGIPARVENRGAKLRAWDEAALAFFTTFLLSAKMEVGYCSIRNAYRNTAIMAREKGWRIGSEASAYQHAEKAVNSSLCRYASGGDRALDNMFYIARRLEGLRPFQVVVGDQHRFDFWVQGEDGKLFRPECYLWLDMRTRLVYGVAFDRSYNTRTVLCALKMGVERYGKFECTYNDNGSSEKSAVADFVIDSLLNYGMRFEDESGLYRTGAGQYVLEDAEGNMLDVVPSRSEWKKRHRRIFAAVKNAKAKPIERFFSTLEQLLLDRCLPGAVKELALSAPEEERAGGRLSWQKKDGYILSYTDFLREVGAALDVYENRTHSTLKKSPRDELKAACVNEGWRPSYIEGSDLFYLFLERAYLTVQGDRVRLLGNDYIGPALTKEMVMQNRGSLAGLNRRKVEVRYDPDNLGAGAWAIDPRDNKPIALHPVKPIDFFDNEALKEQVAWKRGQKKAVRDAFAELTGGAVRELVDRSVFKNLREASSLARDALTGSRAKDPEGEPLIPVPDTAAQEAGLSDEGFKAAVSQAIAGEEVLRDKRKNVFATERDRYESILKAVVSGGRVSAGDLLFKSRMEAGFTDAERLYYENFIKFNF